MAAGWLLAIVFGIGYVVRLMWQHPIATICICFLIWGVTSCNREFNIGATNLPLMMQGGEATVPRFTGSPESCSNDQGMIRCNYQHMAVTTLRGRIVQIDYRRINGEPFNNNADFYKRVLGMFDLPYREPDLSTVDEVVWRVPGIGVIRATSDSDLNVNGVTVLAI